MIKKKLFICLCILLSSPAQAKLTFIPVYHKNPIDIINKIKPFLNEGETVIAGHNELILRTELTDVAELEQIIKRLDQAAHRLRILVKRDNASLDKKHGIDTQARLQLGTHKKLNANVRIYDSSSNRSDKGTQEINVLDGYPAFISEGKIEALPTVQIQHDGSHGHITTGTQFHDATTGFYVTPRLNRNSVTLEISPWSTKTFSRNNGLAPTSRASTIIRGRLNEWIQLSNLDGEENRDQSGLFEKRYQTKRSTQGIWLKVIDLDK